MGFLRSWFGMRGRATRLALWRWLILLLIVAAAFAILIRLLQTNVLTAPMWLKIVMAGTALILLPPTLSVVARRLHDLGWTGFAMFAWALAAAGLIFAALVVQSFALFLLVAALGMTVLFWLFLLFTDGERGPNDYGPDPKRRRAEI